MKDSIAALFATFDAEVDTFTNAACLSCPLGCGDCCDHADPEVSAAETELIVRHIRDEQPGLADHVHRAAADTDHEGCVFYDPKRDFHCMIYSVRPLICRAFGYSAYSDRAGNKLFAVCPSMPIAEKTGPVMQVLFEPYPPVMERYASEIDRISLEGAGTTGKRPLSQAIVRALDREDEPSPEAGC